MIKIKQLPPSFNLSKIEGYLFFAVVFFLPTQFGKHFWPEFTEIFSIKTDYFSPVIYFWDLLIVLMIIVYLVQKKRFSSFPLLLLLFFYFSQIISLFSAGNVMAGLVRFEQYIVTGVFGLYIASQSFNKIRLSLYFALICSIIYSSIIALLQVLKGGTIGLWILGERSFTLDTISIATFDWYGQVFLRAYATFPHPNVLAAFLFISISLLIYIRDKGVYKYSNQLVWTAIISGSIGLLLTFSRVGLLFYGVIFGYILKKRIKILTLVIFFLLPFLYVRFNSAFNFDQLSFIRREELAGHSISLFTQHPLLGVGLNNFIYELAYGAIISGENRFLQPVHSIYLLTLSETGVIGFVGLMSLILIPFYLSLKNKHYLLSFIFISLLGMGFFDHYFLTLAQGQRLLFLVWGISMLEYGNERNVEKGRWPNRMAIGR